MALRISISKFSRSYRSPFVRGKFCSLSTCTETIEFQNEKVDAYFPWRSAPIIQTPSFYEKLKSEASNYMQFVLFSLLVPDVSPSLYWGLDFLKASEDAMSLSAVSIFNKIQSKKQVEKPIKSTVITKTTPPDSVPPDEVASMLTTDLTDIFDERLAHFYDTAIENAQKSRYEILYELNQIGSARTVQHDVIFAGNRKKDMKNHIRVESFGLIGAVISTNRKTFNKSLARDVTVRVAVRVPCKERFYVKDSVTGHILQGSLDEVECDHELLFETVLTQDSPEFEWRIVDIDGWLDGNVFWDTVASISAKEEELKCKASSENDSGGHNENNRNL